MIHRGELGTCGSHLGAAVNKAGQEIGARATPRLRRTAIVLAAVFLLDLFGAGQGLWSLFIAFLGATILVAGAVWAAARGAGAWARSRFMRAAMYVVLGAATVGTMRFHAVTARSRAEQVIAACKAYKAQHGVFPDRLEDLVPGQLSTVPRARYVFLWGNFTYWNWSSGPEQPQHVLMYVALPPFGRRLYHLEEGRWSTMD